MDNKKPDKIDLAPVMWGSGSFILGADVSWVPQNESSDSRLGGRIWSEGGQKRDIFDILRSHGFDYVRLRLFNDPRAEGGYSPEGYCDLKHTKEVVLRLRKCGLGFMLDFHYSDTWADPGKQCKPVAWKDLSKPQLVTALGDFTRSTLRELAAQDTLPSLVSVGNEITHGMLWDDAKTSNDWPFFASLLAEGSHAVKDVSPASLVVIHIDRGQLADLTADFAANLAKYQGPYDVLALSCYTRDKDGKMQPEYADALKGNIAQYTRMYHKPVILAEYGASKLELNEAIYGVPGGMGLGTVVWEPTVEGYWGPPLFDRSGAALPELSLYDDFRKRFTAPRAWPRTSEQRNTT